MLYLYLEAKSRYKLTEGKSLDLGAGSDWPTKGLENPLMGPGSVTKIGYKGPAEDTPI